MLADKTTITDLSIFHQDNEQSVFHLLDFTTTTGGRHWLKHLLENPFSSIDKITETQEALQSIIRHSHQWQTGITNGTIMVVEKFYETPFDTIPQHPHLLNTFFYKLTSGQDYSLIKYSVRHFIDFFKSLKEITRLFSHEKMPKLLVPLLKRLKTLLQQPHIKAMSECDSKALDAVRLLQYAAYLRYYFKEQALNLVDIYNRLDAYKSLATACTKLQLCFPDFITDGQPYFEASDLFHPLLQQPVSYHVLLNRPSNFLFLTGANMAGKSTFIKAVGVAVYLAHVGMGVPAKNMRLSLFDGMVSNIHVEDNIVRGESYFFNEVQRIKKTVEKISDGKLWLILIDELFKGTNVQDAMRCSTAVIEGLLKMKNALFILSTHLYEISEALKHHSNIQFNYFETGMEKGQLLFNYQLKEGISNDRLGYLILQKEGVVEMLNKIGSSES